MKKRKPIIVPLDDKNRYYDITNNNLFLKTIQTAVLLSLLEKGQLSKQQFDFCLEKQEKTLHSFSSEGY